MGFENLEEIVILGVQFTTKSALAISAGRQPGETIESPVVSLGDKPVIPGSSLKGAIRSTLESIFMNMGVKVCVPFAAIPRSVRQEEERKNKYLAEINRLAPCGNIKNPCPVCSIFGTVGGQTGLSGKAIILDAKVEDGAYDLIERSHVAIARDTKAQAEGSLMSIQAVDAGATFVGEIRIINPEQWQVGAIARSLEGISVLGMGSKRTSGYGELEITIADVEKRIFKDGVWQNEKVELTPYLDAFGQKYRK